jgi:CHAT domain-containing protein
MSAGHDEKKWIRQYLLGEIAEESELRLIEERFLSDDLFFQELSMAEEELIDEYLSDELDKRERERFEKHFLSTPERRQQLRFARALHRRASEGARVEGAAVMSRTLPPPRRPFYASPWAAVAAVVILLAAGFAVWRVGKHWSARTEVAESQRRLSEGLQALNNAYRTQRPLEARITGLDYAPWVQTRGDERAPFNEQSLELAERLLLEAEQREPGAASHHALGKFYLSKREFAKADAQFKLALAADTPEAKRPEDARPRDARIHNDAGVALMEHATFAGQGASGAPSIEKLSEALEHFKRALELDASLGEAVFNRALCYEEMRLWPQAAEDWREYLLRDSDSRWADEAKQHLERIERQADEPSQTKESLWNDFVLAYRTGDEARAWEPVIRSSTRVGNSIIERLSFEYLDAREGDRRSDADESLRMLAYVAKLHARRTGDRYHADLYDLYRRADSSRLRELVAARAAVAEGQRQIATSDYKAALDSYGRAKRGFERAGDDGEALQASYWLAICFEQLNDKERSAALLKETAWSCDEHDYKWLNARIHNALATHQFTANEYSKAIATARRAAGLAEEAHDAYGLLSAFCFLAETYRYVGNYQEALRHVQLLLPLAETIRQESKQQWLAFNEAAWTLNSNDFHAAAAAYQRAALRFAEELREPSMISLSYGRLGVIYSAARDFARAVQHTQEALRVGEAHASKPSGQKMMAYSSLQLGDIYRKAKDFDKAIASYKQSIELYSKLDTPAFLYQAHKGALLSYVALKNIPAAREELETTLRLYEEYRDNIIEEGNRYSFTDAEHTVFDAAADFEYSTMNDPARAFEYSEAARARVLRDMMSGDGEAPMPSLAEIRSRLPARAQILQYAVLEDKLLIWVVSSDDFSPFTVPITSRQLGEKVQDFVKSVALPSRMDEEAARTARQLYAILIAPAEPKLDTGKTLFIVPDKALHRVPFGALVSPASGKYLVEERTFALAPSSEVMVAASKTTQGMSQGSEEDVLSVGNPDFDREEFPELPDLPAASREAREVATLYPNSTLLQGKLATKERVVGAMQKAAVIHLATHAISDDIKPARSLLALARERAAATRDEFASSLSASDIYGMHLPRARLVVLSACQTNAGRVYRGEGVMSLSRTFLAVGAPQVVASLWAVDSEATAELMVRFHRRRKHEGLSSVEALRQAQLELIHSPRASFQSPFYWAAFTITGGYADF